MSHCLRSTTRLALAAVLVLLPAAAAAAEPGHEDCHADAPAATASSSGTSASSAGPATHPATPWLAPASYEHYARLATLPAAAQPGSGGLDRRQFALSAMSPRYLAILDAAPTYLDLPPDALELADFPANSSAQTRAELDYLLGLQEKRTPQQVEASKVLAGVYYRLSVQPGDADWERMRGNLFHMGRQLGDWFAPARLPFTADFMSRVWSDASYYLWAAKFRYNRIRPYSLEPRLENLETPNFPAYPSGHAGNSYVAAYVYALLLPEHLELFERNADDMAFSREILGVHFPSDSASGRDFARALVDRLQEVPAFRNDLERARREILAAHAAAAAETAPTSESAEREIASSLRSSP